MLHIRNFIVSLRILKTKLNKMEEHKTEIAYWAGRLIGYDQAWEVAEEIVETINEAQDEICPYCKRTEPCAGSYPEGCFHPKGK